MKRKSASSTARMKQEVKVLELTLDYAATFKAWNAARLKSDRAGIYHPNGRALTAAVLDSWQKHVKAERRLLCAARTLGRLQR